jgi:hypothetical protein
VPVLVRTRMLVVIVIVVDVVVCFCYCCAMMMMLSRNRCSALLCLSLVNEKILSMSPPISKSHTVRRSPLTTKSVGS